MLAAACFLPTAGFSAPKSARAATPSVLKTCAAATEDFTAVAHGKTVYLLDGEKGGVWQTYEHTETISHLALHGATLYFVDRLSATYTLALDGYTEGNNAQATGLTCSVFTLDENFLYFVQQDWIYKAPLDDLSAEQALYSPSLTSPSVAQYAGKLYYLYGQNYLYCYDLATNTDEGEVSPIPRSTAMAVADGNFYFLTKEGEVRGYTLADLEEGDRSTPLLSQSGGSVPYSSVSANGATLYLTKGNELFTYEAGETTPTKAPQNSYPTANAIPLGNAKAALSANDTATVARIQTQENALLFEVDLQASETYFHPLRAKRAALRGMQLYQDANYTLFACYEGGYKTYLTANQNVSAQETGYTPAALTGYASGKGKLYKYPLLSADFPALGETERNQKLEIVGEIEGLDGKYYAVKIGEKTGYLPAAQTRLFDGSSPDASQIELGERGGTQDAVWRLAYLLLGGVALCILADFLILRRKPKDD